VETSVLDDGMLLTHEPEGHVHRDTTSDTQPSFVDPVGLAMAALGGVQAHGLAP
jgi:hypothetical protein